MMGFDIQPDVWYFANIDGIGNCFFRTAQVEPHGGDHLCVRNLSVPQVTQGAPGMVNVTVIPWQGYTMRLVVDPLHFPLDAFRCLARPGKETTEALDQVHATVKTAAPADVNRLRHLNGRTGE